MHKYIIPLIAFSLAGCIKLPLPKHSASPKETPRSQGTDYSNLVPMESPLLNSVLKRHCDEGDKRACNVRQLLIENCPKNLVDLSTLYACWANGYPITTVFFDSSAGPLPTPPVPMPVKKPSSEPTIKLKPKHDTK